MRNFVAYPLALIVLTAFPKVASPQFTSFQSGGSILEGNWQSCREDDGQYSERIYDHKMSDGRWFEFHMGPYHDFALFLGVQDEHRDHNLPENLLQPYQVVLDNNLAGHEWKVPQLQLNIKVSLAGGSRDDCESWFVVMTSTNKKTPAEK